MKLSRIALVAAFVAGGVTSAAQAGHSHAYNVYQPTPGVHTHGVHDQTTNGTYVLHRDGHDDGLVTVVYANTTPIRVNPHVKYDGGTIGGLDHNHSLVRAQRLYHALHGKPTRVIRNAPEQMDDTMMTAGRLNIHPRVIIEVPENFKNPDAQPQPKQNTPADETKPRQMASAE